MKRDLRKINRKLRRLEDQQRRQLVAFKREVIAAAAAEIRLALEGVALGTPDDLTFLERWDRVMGR